MCFLKQREHRIRCMYKISGCNLWMPREFYWENTSQADCNSYIDLLARKRLIEAKHYEDSKLATEHTYDKGEFHDRPFVNVSAQRLIALLRGEEVLEVPIDARIRIVPSTGRHTANDVDASIFSAELTDQYFASIRRMVGEGRPIVCAVMPEMQKTIEKYGYRLCDEKLHSGFNLEIATEGLQKGPLSGNFEGAPAPVEETSISMSPHSTHTETVSLITGNGQVPYFVKRLLRDPHLLWSGTAYHADGPWTEYHRDQSRLTALGITIA